MGLRQLYDKTEAEYRSVFFKLLDDYGRTLSEMLSAEGGHAIYAHCGLGEEQLKSRVEQENIPAATTFINRAEMNYYLEQALSYKVDEISKWFFQGYPANSKARLHYENLELTIDIGELDVGFGYKKERTKGKTELAKYATSAMTVVLKRSHDPNSQFGFYVNTVYPTITKKASIRQMEPQERFESKLEREIIENYL